MNTPLDAQVLSSQMSGQELTRRKLEMDALRGRLTDPAGKDKKLREAVEGFEAIFVQQIWQKMRATLPKEGYLHSKDEEFWQGMFDQELAKKMTAAGGIGLSDMLYDQLKGKLGDASRTTAPSRVATPLPLEPLREADRPIPEEPLKPEGLTVDPLYTPLEQGGTTPEKPASPRATAPAAVSAAMPASTPPRHMPPSFTKADAADMAQVEELARSLVTGTPAQGTAPATDFGTRPLQNSDINSGIGGPAPRNPEMGMLNWPLPGNLSSDFGWRDNPFGEGREWHAGVDIVGETGDPISAAWDGKVVFAGDKDGYGNLVVLEHKSGWQSYYGHASKISVKVGDEIRSGRKIAEVGSTGRSTGPHLHFEIRQGELAWNPEKIRNRLLAGLPVGRRS